jgi:CHASE3 domain sensor protein
MLETLLSPNARRLIILGLIVPCLLISIPAVLVYRTESQLRDSFHWVSHTIQVQNQLQRLLSLVANAESGQRGFLLISRTTFLEPYSTALQEIPAQMETIRGLLSDNPVQEKNFQVLTPLVRGKLEFMAQTISLQQHDQHEQSVAMVKTDHGRMMMRAIRLQVDKMQREEDQLLDTRQAALVRHGRHSTVLVFALVMLNFAFAGAIFGILRRLSQARNLVTICAWSRTVEYEGEWISFEKYLLRRFKLNTSHGISPEEVRKALGEMQHDPD